MCDPECSWIFQAVAQHAVHADVRGPDEHVRKQSLKVESESDGSEAQWKDVIVGDVIGGSAYSRIEKIGQHRQIRGKQQRGEEPPTGRNMRV